MVRLAACAAVLRSTVEWINRYVFMMRMRRQASQASVSDAISILIARARVHTTHTKAKQIDSQPRRCVAHACCTVSLCAQHGLFFTHHKSSSSRSNGKQREREKTPCKNVCALRKIRCWRSAQSAFSFWRQRVVRVFVRSHSCVCVLALSSYGS